jgi:D-sedoheptulose 7-phosphate isomerase
MSMFNIKNYFSAHTAMANEALESSFAKGVEIIRHKFKEGRMIITCGNGGSAHAASHYITDWNKMVNLATGRQFRGVSLSDNIGLITAYANDLSYSDIFSGQLRNICQSDDLVIAVSGSGNSENVVQALRVAKELGAMTMAIVGYDGGELKKIADYSVHIPSFDMQICEDWHLVFGHVVMKSLCGSEIRA